jgi:hypothetical protein
MNILREVNFEPWHNEATHHKIKVKMGLDILQWGHSTKGTFMIKRVYNLKE